jgi:hypothetical protein
MLCHHFNCVFVHIPKAAGQSVEQVFLKALDLTWDTRAPLLLRPNDNPRLGPRSLAHLTAQEYVDKKYMTPEQYSKYFKFTFVRNPYARLVSTYVYFDYINKLNYPSFVKTIVSKNINEMDTRHFLPQNKFISDSHGNSLVDFVGHFETLQIDFDHICNCIGMPNTKLPHANKTKLAYSQNIISTTKSVINLIPAWRRNMRLKNHFMDYYY